MSISLKQLNAINSIEQLQALFPSITYEISHRGGHVGIRANSLATALNVPENNLPPNVGAFTNYLGGGMRGTVQASTFAPLTTTRNEKRLNAFCDACKRVYASLENESGLNDLEDEDGETNWDAVATAAARKSGINSAY